MTFGLVYLSNVTWPGWAEHHLETAKDFVLEIAAYLDLPYLQWLAWVFTPILVAFLLPALLLIMLYGSAMFLHIYKYRKRIQEDFSRDIWAGGRSAIASFWNAQGRIWHGYEIHGAENIPLSGPALIVYFHGTLPLDIYYLMAKTLLDSGRVIRCVGDKFLFKIPGWQLLMKVFDVTPGSLPSCVADLEKGHVLCISPGGVREALFSSPSEYDILWGKRSGFAKVALKAKVPIIPMFTENCRETFRIPPIGTRFFRWLYETTRLPLVPIYGGFPVKLRTYIGTPLYFPDYGMKREIGAITDSGMDDSFDSKSSAKLHRRSRSIDEKGFGDKVRKARRSRPHLENSKSYADGFKSEQEWNERESALSPAELAQVTKTAVENLIEKHQILPGSISRAMLDRIPPLRKLFIRSE